MMWFQLLHGRHQETVDGEALTYIAESVMDPTTGQEVYVQPVFQSNQNLAELFGRRKFRPLTDAEAAVLNQAGGSDSVPTDAVDSHPRSNPEPPALSGAPAEKEHKPKKAPPKRKPKVVAKGKNVTVRFPAAKKANLQVFFVSGKGYHIYDQQTGEEFTSAEGGLTRGQVTPFCEEHSKFVGAGTA